MPGAAECTNSTSETRLTVMMIGLGKLGGPVLDELATRFPQHRFVCVSRSEAGLSLRANLSRYRAAQWGSFPEVITERCDLRDESGTTDLLSRHKPDVVFNATTPFPWWRLRELPRDLADRANVAGPGMWCTLDCLLPFCLCNAIMAASISPTHVNACYGDMTNAFLSDLPSAPRLGIGNLSNLVPGLRLAFADELRTPASEIRIRLVAHHAVSWAAPTDAGSKAPFHLVVSHPRGKLVYEGPDDTCFAIMRRRASRTRGLAGLGVTIGSAVTVLSALMDGEGGEVHCPGALGHPGGYPVRISRNREIHLDLDETLPFPRALAINQDAQRIDGVDHVGPGHAVPTEAAREAFVATVGMELPNVTFDNLEEHATETLHRLDARYGLELLP